MSDTKIIHGSLDEIVEAVVDVIIDKEWGKYTLENLIRSALERFVQPNEWISVEDRLPELEESVLLFDQWKPEGGKDYRDVRVGYLNRIETHKTLGVIVNNAEWVSEYAFNITHWMPLPTTPTKGGDDEG